MVTPYANPHRSAGRRRTTAYIPDNGYAERLIGSIRRECLDHTVVFGEGHLRRIAAAYTGYYNECRTHLSLDKDSPGRRPIQRLGQLAAQPILGGQHHEYCRTLVRT
jgi:transposase InsO family protein